MVDKLVFSDQAPAPRPVYVSGETEWRNFANCKGPDMLKLFYGPGHFERKDEKLDREERAKRICATCTVIEPCLEWAIATQEPQGVQGGMSVEDRRPLIAIRRAKG